MVTVKTGSEGLQDRQVIFVDQCHCADLAVRIVSIRQEWAFDGDPNRYLAYGNPLSGKFSGQGTVLAMMSLGSASKPEG